MYIGPQTAPKGLAYLDSFSGLIPCKVLRLVHSRCLEIQITTTRGAYKRGDVLEQSPHSVVPRSAVRLQAHTYRIRPHKWQGTASGVHCPDHIQGNR